MLTTNNNKKFIKDWDTFLEKRTQETLAIVYNNYFDFLFYYGKRFHSENQLIEDAIQNVFISMMKIRKQSEGIKNPHSYLLTSFRNELFRLISKRRGLRLHDSLPEEIFDFEYNLETEIIQNETDSNLKHILNKSIKKLTSSQQEILFLRYNAGLSYDDISRTLNISLQSCRTAVYRAVKKIKSNIKGLL